MPKKKDKEKKKKVKGEKKEKGDKKDKGEKKEKSEKKIEQPEAIPKEVEEDYHRKLEQVQNLENKLEKRKRESEKEITRLEKLRREIQEEREKVELVTTKDYQGVLRRLHDEENRKLAIVNVEIQNMEQLGKDVESFSKNICRKKTTKAEIDEFLSEFRTNLQHGTLLAQTSTGLELGIKPDEYPRETEARLGMLKHYSDIEEKHLAAEHMVQFLLEERKTKMEEHEKQLKQIEELDRATREEMGEWVVLVDRFAESINSLKLKCQFCSIPLSQESANSFCEVNSPELQDRPEPEEEGQYGAPGSNQHFFIKY